MSVDVASAPSTPGGAPRRDPLRRWLTLVVLVGFSVTCKGTVTGKSVQDGRHLVDCSLTCESELGFVTNLGTAQVELPSRAG